MFSILQSLPSRATYTSSALSITALIFLSSPLFGQEVQLTRGKKKRPSQQVYRQRTAGAGQVVVARPAAPEHKELTMEELHDLIEGLSDNEPETVYTHPQQAQVTQTVQYYLENDSGHTVVMTWIIPGTQAGSRLLFSPGNQLKPPPIDFKANDEKTVTMLVESPHGLFEDCPLHASFLGLYCLKLNGQTTPQQVSLQLSRLLTSSRPGQVISRSITFPQANDGAVTALVKKKSFATMPVGEQLKEVIVAPQLPPPDTPAAAPPKPTPTPPKPSKPDALTPSQTSGTPEESRLTALLVAGGSLGGAILSKGRDVAVATPGAVAGAASTVSNAASGVWSYVGSWWSGGNEKDEKRTERIPTPPPVSPQTQTPTPPSALSPEPEPEDQPQAENQFLKELKGTQKKFGVRTNGNSPSPTDDTTHNTPHAKPQALILPTEKVEQTKDTKGDITSFPPPPPLPDEAPPAIQDSEIPLPPPPPPADFNKPSSTTGKASGAAGPSQPKSSLSLADQLKTHQGLKTVDNKEKAPTTPGTPTPNKEPLDIKAALLDKFKNARPEDSFDNGNKEAGDDNDDDDWSD